MTVKSLCEPIRAKVTSDGGYNGHMKNIKLSINLRVDHGLVNSLENSETTQIYYDQNVNVPKEQTRYESPHCYNIIQSTLFMNHMTL